MTEPPRASTFTQALLPVLFLSALILYGLILRPQFFDQPAIPLEILFILAAAFTIGELFVLGHTWETVQHTIVQKLAKALPAFFILFAIGVLISSWIVSGTIPSTVRAKMAIWAAGRRSTDSGRSFLKVTCRAENSGSNKAIICSVS